MYLATVAMLRSASAGMDATAGSRTGGRGQAVEGWVGEAPPGFVLGASGAAEATGEGDAEGTAEGAGLVDGVGVADGDAEGVAEPAGVGGGWWAKGSSWTAR